MDKCREQFEEWAINTKDHFGVPFFTIKNANGKYVDHGTEISWQAWQASRQALVVELPRARSDVDYGYEPSEIVDLLELAGIKCT